MIIVLKDDFLKNEPIKILKCAQISLTSDIATIVILLSATS